MPRPPKPRTVCHIPKYLVYGPKGKKANSLDRLYLLMMNSKHFV
ncbi:MAG: hypothetical protein RQ856_04755 [Candidatus Izemoplasmatales bacterium]|nr:hypothetical protein [Candidatus Izemoplasmatales bacterium]